ncbi:MAG: hypothetical protein LQ337_007006, partial [Flavoplaca oasis]
TLATSTSEPNHCNGRHKILSASSRCYRDQLQPGIIELPVQSDKNGAAGSKRKAGANTPSPQPKKGRKGAKKAQATIEETMPTEGAGEETKDMEMTDEHQSPTAAHDEANKEQTQEFTSGEAEQKPHMQAKEKGSVVKEDDQAEQNPSEAREGDAVEKSTIRD